MESLRELARMQDAPAQDFKYCMQDVSRVYLGARLSYAEMMEDANVPFKLKTIISRYFRHEVSEETTLESHFYYMRRDAESFRVYKQLRAKIRATQYREGRTDAYREKTWTVDELTMRSPEEKEAAGMFVREIILSKLALSGFQV